MSPATKTFAAEYANLFPKFEGNNELFIDADNPHANEVLAYMKSIGAEIGWNSHDMCPIEDYSTGMTIYCANKPVWVFKAPMSAKEFRVLLKSKNWLKRKSKKS